MLRPLSTMSFHLVAFGASSRRCVLVTDTYSPSSSMFSIVNVSGRVPMLLSMSKYCVISSKSTTSLEEAPLICSFDVKSLIEFLRPSTMALRCRATPTPARYFDSASASADFSYNTLSPSAFSAAASFNLLDALISFMALRTR